MEHLPITNLCPKAPVIDRPKWLQLALVMALCTIAPASRAVLLSDLFSGASVSDGVLLLDDWQLVSADVTAATDPDWEAIEVVSLGDDPLAPGVRVVANGQFGVFGINAIDLILTFHVHVLAGSPALAGATVTIESITLDAESAIAMLTAELAGTGGTDLGSAVAYIDAGVPFPQLSATTAFPAQQEVVVTSNLFLTGVTPGDTIQVNAFTYRFVTVPAPTSAAVTMGGMAWYSRRKHRAR